MKIQGFAAALFVAQASAFTVRAPKTASVAALQAEALPSRSMPSDMVMFPSDLRLERIEGGGTIRTFPLPLGCERVQMFLTTNGRPMKAYVELWTGPIRQTHGMQIDTMNGEETPFRAVLRFKPDASHALKVSTTSTVDFPVSAGMVVCSPAQNEALDAATKKLWAESPKTMIQGRSVQGGLGAVRSFPIHPNVKSVQLIFWSIDTSKKSIQARIEVTQGPNTAKQAYDFKISGGHQPYTCVVETPGDAVTLRVINKKYIEDGLFEIVVVPYETIGDIGDAGVGQAMPQDARTSLIPPPPGSARWWEKKR